MKAELKPYPAYHHAESGWLGQIPVGWKAIQLARLNSKLTNGFVGPTRDILLQEGIRYLQSLHIKGGKIIFDTPYFVSEEWSEAHKKSVLKVGDVLIVQTGDIGQVAAVTDEFEGCNCHALIIVCAKPKMIDGFFLSAVLRSHYGFHSLKQVQTGALHPHLNCTYIRDIFLPVPSLEEQRAILAFLDRETAKIDRLMEVRRKQVDRLREQRTAVIHHAVTKGLNPNAQMKSSGVDWLGDVPANWQVERYKFRARVRSGFPFKSEFFSIENGHPLIRIRDIDSESTELLYDADWVEAARVDAGDILVGMDGDFNVARWRGVPGLLNQRVCSLVAGLTLREGYLFHLISFPLRSVNDLCYFTTVKHLSVSDLKNIFMCVPPLEQQDAIVAHIERETEKLDTLTAKYLRELELLAEYRASLISHAVTGKIDVRGLVSPVTDERP